MDSSKEFAKVVGKYMTRMNRANKRLNKKLIKRFRSKGIVTVDPGKSIRIPIHYSREEEVKDGIHQ